MPAVDVTLLAFAAECCAPAPLLLIIQRPPLSIVISCQHGTQQQTHHTLGLWSNDGTGKPADRQMDVQSTVS